MKKLTQKYHQFKKMKPQQRISVLAGVVALILFLFLAISSIVLQRSLNTQSQDVRGKAYVEHGSTVLNLVPPPGQSQAFNINQQHTIQLQANTGSSPIDGIQLFFEVRGTKGMLPSVTLEPTAGLGLNFIKSEVSKISCDQDCYQVTLAGITPNPDQPFITMGNHVTLAEIKVTPLVEGELQIIFSNPQSIALAHRSGTNDQLVKPQEINSYTVVDPAKSQATCSDYDSTSNYPDGKNLFLASVIRGNGSTSQNNQCPSGSCSDFCYQDLSNPQPTKQAKNINEWYCDQNQISYTRQACSGECLNGACVNKCAYVYSDWGECVNGWQQRSHKVEPQDCIWFETPSLEETTRSCGSNSSANNKFHIYNYESCWFGESAGGSTYIYWDKANFPDVSWVDISRTSDFKEYAHKNVEGKTSDYFENLLINGTGFKWSHGGQSDFKFSPATTYYLRLYNGSHSPVVTFSMPQCSTGGVSYKQCDESCNSNKDCSPNLGCFDNKCRHVSNPESSICALKPDAGLDRVCNEYCANTSQCQDGLTCWWNRCRQPNNLESTQCSSAKTTSAINSSRSVVALSCNQTCQNNHQCDANLRCYFNQCRLAANPDDDSCGIETDNSLSAKNEATSEAQAENNEDATPTPVVAQKSTSPEQETAWDALLQYIQDQGFDWKKYGLAAGGFGLLMMFIKLIGGKKTTQPTQKLAQPTPSSITRQPKKKGAVKIAPPKIEPTFGNQVKTEIPKK